MRIDRIVPLVGVLLGASALNPAGRFPLGTYVGNPNGNDAGAMASFKRQFDAHVAAMGGVRPKYFNIFTDFGQEPDRWPESARWAAWSSTQSGNRYVAPGSGMIPLVGVPLASGRGGWGNVDAFYRDTVAGKYDAAWTGIVDAYAGVGYKTVDFRIAYEMDGNFMPWAPGNSNAPGARADFVAAFRHVADAIHREGRAKHIRAVVHWNPAAINDSGYDIATLYPGDAYVDVIAVDLYSPMYPLTLLDWSSGGQSDLKDRAQWAAIPANRAHYWRYANASKRIPVPKLGNWGWSMAQTIAFAKLHHKPLGVDESGTGTSGQAIGPADDGEFPKALAAMLAEARGQGVPIHVVSIWDTQVSDGDWDFKNGSKPRAAAAWARWFGLPRRTGTERPR